MTISMLALAGIPATAGFTGKFYLIDAAASGGYTWLGVMIVIGSMISLGYYLPVVAAMWMRRGPGQQPSRQEPLPALAGGSPELDRPQAPQAEPAAEAPQREPAAEARDPSNGGRAPEVALVAVLAAAATIFLGIVPQPLFNLVRGAGAALGLH